MKRRSVLPEKVALAAMSFAAAAIMAGPAMAGIPPDTTDPKAVMKAVDDRPTGDRAVSRMQMTIIDANGAKKVRVVRAWAMDFKEGKKQLIFFESPDDVRNTALLTIDYSDGSKVDDQWLYTPTIKKMTRISSSKKSGSFMGSDLSYSDMTELDIDQYEYQMIKQSVTVGGEDCWLIGAKPTTKKAKDETGYAKSMTWVSKSKLMPLQVKHWVQAGRKLKLIKFSKHKKVDGIWVAHKITAKTVQNKNVLSSTVLSFAGMKFNDPSVKASEFTQRRLEQGL